LALTDINREKKNKKRQPGQNVQNKGETNSVEVIAAAFGPTKAQSARELTNSQLKSSSGCHDLEERKSNA
jgi:hypothetical protein